MNWPDWLYRWLDAAVARERRRRRLANDAEVARQDRALRAWAERARTAHAARSCLDGCPFAGHRS